MSEYNGSQSAVINLTSNQSPGKWSVEWRRLLTADSDLFTADLFTADYCKQTDPSAPSGMFIQTRIAVLGIYIVNLASKTGKQNTDYRSKLK